MFDDFYGSRFTTDNDFYGGANGRRLYPTPSRQHLLSLLAACGRDDLGVAPSWGSSSQGLTQTQLFASLMRTVDATYSINNEDTLRQYISQYLKGERTNSKTYYPSKNPASEVEPITG
jgi:hypothetical protein